MSVQKPPTLLGEKIRLSWEQSDHMNSVNDFMLRARQEAPLMPCWPSTEVRMLRASLILEEAFELINAMGVAVRVVVDGGWQRPYYKTITDKDLSLTEDTTVKPSKRQIVEVVDGAEQWVNVAVVRDVVAGVLLR